MPSRKDLEQAAEVSAELQRRREVDPLLMFEPHPKQKLFIDSVLGGKVRQNWLIAANRSGKSDAGAVCGATLARFGRDSGKIGIYEGGRLTIKDRATSGWVSALSFPVSRDVIQPKYFDNGNVPPGATHAPFIPAHEIEKDGWNKTEQVLKLKNGSIVGFKSADSGPAKYQGAEKDWIHFDEEHPKEIYEESIIRVGAMPLLIFNTVTLLPPLGVVGGASWIFEAIIKPWQAGELKNSALFGAAIYDNPHIPQSEIEALEAFFAEGTVSRRIRLGGEWLPGLGGSRAYTSFDRRLNVRKLGEINMRRPLCWVWDFNVSPQVSLVGQKHASVYRVFREFVLEEGSIPEMCDWFRQVYPRHLAEILVFGDATGRNRSPQSNASNYTVMLNAMQQYGPVRLQVPELNPPVSDRVNAVNGVCKNQFSEVCLEIDPSCVELIADMEGVLLEKRGGIRKSRNPKDPYYRRTHTSDALGYWIAQDEPVLMRTQTPAPVRIPSPGYSVQKPLTPIGRIIKMR